MSNIFSGSENLESLTDLNLISDNSFSLIYLNTLLGPVRNEVGLEQSDVIIVGRQQSPKSFEQDGLFCQPSLGLGLQSDGSNNTESNSYQHSVIYENETPGNASVFEGESNSSFLPQVEENFQLGSLEETYFTPIPQVENAPKNTNNEHLGISQSCHEFPDPKPTLQFSEDPERIQKIRQRNKINQRKRRLRLKEEEKQRDQILNNTTNEIAELKQQIEKLEYKVMQLIFQLRILSEGQLAH